MPIRITVPTSTGTFTQTQSQFPRRSLSPSLRLIRRVCFVNKYTIFELVIENTSVRHEPTYHNGIKVPSLVIYTCVKSCSVHLLRFISVHKYYLHSSNLAVNTIVHIGHSSWHRPICMLTAWWVWLVLKRLQIKKLRPGQPNVNAMPMAMAMLIWQNSLNRSGQSTRNLDIISHNSGSGARGLETRL